MFKKILSAALCLSMLTSTAIPAFAGNITTDGEAGKTIVSYGMSESFTVIIPSDFNIYDGEATANVSAENVMIGNGKFLVVRISGDDYIDSWELIDQQENNNRLEYVIGSANGANDIVNNSPVLIVAAGESYNSTVTETLYFTVVDELTKSGTYTDTLTFTVNIGSSILEGDGQTFYTLTPSELSFRSNEPLNEFQQVLVNGVPVDPSNYVLTEGSTIVTLKTEYLETLDEAGYRITVVSDNNSPSAGFNVVEQTINDQFFYYDVPYMFADEEGNIVFNGELGGFCGIMMQEDGTLYFVGIDGQLWPGISVFEYSVDGNIMTASNDEFGTIQGTISDDGKSIVIPGFGMFSMNTITDVAMSEGEYFYVYGNFFGEFLGGPFVLDKEKAYYNIPLYNINGKILPFDYSFADCENVKQITIPFGAEEIGVFCFLRCYSLEKLILPSTLKSIDSSAFNYCSSLTTIEFRGTVEQWNKITKASNWNREIPATQVICSDGVVEI